jgi:hypothetical protein
MLVGREAVEIILKGTAHVAADSVKKRIGEMYRIKAVQFGLDPGAVLASDRSDLLR